MPSPRHLRALLREPLLHFLFLGALLFVVNAVRGGGPTRGPDQRRIEITQDDLNQITAVWQAQGRGTPTPGEMRNLLEVKIREEVLYREALGLGLEKDDTIVKRRMAQKMEFLTEDLSDLRDPTPEELRVWFEQNAESFSFPPLISFRQLYFSYDKHGRNTKMDAARVLAEIEGEPVDSARATALSDPFLFQDNHRERSPDQVASDFGGMFSRSVFEMEPGAWRGPVESGFGWHLVFVDSVVPGRIPGFEEVEDRVRLEWVAERRREFKEQTYEAMRSRYEIVLPDSQAVP